MIGLGLAMTCAACAARQPSEARAERLIQRYFAHYGKKYQDTLYGTQPVTEVQVRQIAEVHKFYVLATTDLTHRGGARSQARLALEKRPPLGWRVVAWERLDASPLLPTSEPAASAP